MSYRIERQCWNSNTYNGFEDRPYWAISINGRHIGLKDNGEYWSMENPQFKIDAITKVDLKIIIKECKLNIKLK